MKRTTVVKILVLTGVVALAGLTLENAWSQNAAAPVPVVPKPLDRAKAKEKYGTGQGYTMFWSFDKDEAGQVPKGWKPAQTGQGTLGKWQVIQDPDGSQLGRVVALVETKNKGNTLNLLLAESPKVQDLCLQVDFKILGGSEDRGAGIVWRAQDGDNYYLARWNVGENFRVYVTKDGKRKLLAEAKMEFDPGVWHELEIKHNGNHILAELDEADLIDVEDATLAGPGMVGLWTKADATTAFDDVRLSETKAAPAKPAGADAGQPGGKDAAPGPAKPKTP